MQGMAGAIANAAAMDASKPVETQISRPIGDSAAADCKD